MLKEFKTFLLRGNVVDLAVAVVIGTAFAKVVSTFTASVITPIVGMFGGLPFNDIGLTLNGSRFNIGALLDAVFMFVITAAAVFFLVVQPVNALMARRRTEPDVESPTRDCPECLSSIPVGARRCAFCTAEVVPAG
ncbi:MAG TPA: large conductance mechanosensitive channel protein MscL [Acidimicrobiales bacterium]|nr:large conductance mechanosensitive channel protein MscL [Acidimicrobiales bacterium]